MLQQERDGLTAAAGPPLVPPREWFEMPEPDEPTGWTVTADGQVYGHAALWGTCHTGKPGRCITPPKSRSDYAYYKTGLTEVDDGELLPTGRITLGTGHASLTASPAATAEHYDNTGAVAADVNVVDGKHGIWVSGAIRPDVPPERIRTLRGASLSGDWRSIKGALEMLGLLAVNVPGFPVPRGQALTAAGRQELYEDALDANDEIVALVAAGTFTAQELESEQEPSEAEWEDAIASLQAAADKSEKFTSRQAKIRKVMREFKAGKLKSSTGAKVTSRKQAIAIALSEARMTASADDLAEVAELAAAAFDESKHPRHEAGRKDGGQFAPKGDRSGLATGMTEGEARRVLRTTKSPAVAQAIKERFPHLGHAYRKELAAKDAANVRQMARDLQSGDRSAMDILDEVSPAQDPAKAVPQDTPRRKAYRRVFDANDKPIGPFAELPKHVNLDAATRYSGSPEYTRVMLRDLPVGTVHYDGFGNLRIKLSDPRADGSVSVTNPSRTPIAERATTMAYVPKKGWVGDYMKSSGELEDDQGLTAAGADCASKKRKALTGAKKDKEKGEPADNEGAEGEMMDSEEMGEPPEATEEPDDTEPDADEDEEPNEGDGADAEAQDAEGAETVKKGKKKMMMKASAEECLECEQPAFDPMSLPAAAPREPADFGGAIRAASFTTQQREKLAEKGHAMSDGSFPIRNRSDLRNAIQSVGRASDPEAAKRWIIKRARELKTIADLPAAWGITASAEEVVAAAPFDESKHPRKGKGEKGGGQWTVKTTNAEGTTSEAKYSKGTAEYDYKSVRDNVAHVRQAQLIDPEGNVRAQFNRDRKISSDSNTSFNPKMKAPPVPRELARSGAEYYGKLGGKHAWVVTVKPPSGIEKDIVYVQDGREVRKATDADFEGKVEFASGEMVASGTFTETQHPRHPAGSKQGGEFAPKGTSKIAPRPDEVRDMKMGGKLIYGPGGKLMSRQEAGRRLDEAQGRKVANYSDTPDDSHMLFQNALAVDIGGTKWYPDMPEAEWNAEMQRPNGTLVLTDDSGEQKFMKPSEFVAARKEMPVFKNRDLGPAEADPERARARAEAAAETRAPSQPKPGDMVHFTDNTGHVVNGRVTRRAKGIPGYIVEQGGVEHHLSDEQITAINGVTKRKRR